MLRQHTILLRWASTHAWKLWVNFYLTDYLCRPNAELHNLPYTNSCAQPPWVWFEVKRLNFSDSGSLTWLLGGNCSFNTFVIKIKKQRCFFSLSLSTVAFSRITTISCTLVLMTANQSRAAAFKWLQNVPLQVLCTQLSLQNTHFPLLKRLKQGVQFYKSLLSLLNSV